ncbi:hypothetical protein KAR29_08230 [Aminithiophilus ramosus]|uniref:FG-GAP repeat protein n=2 Tax=Synergistales TaxID=649776 RepID=A0A9Q7ADB6_9BACT|nr:FG-GAP-like repeat-containing protein [Aminithiophilus ramosus]QTX31369.1 hypothetical protein KAR29_08230 [Aminithiophilus ramosus]QVL35168.1 hypothetical protein KIH16_08050 [Synergistota bacterium]
MCAHACSGKGALHALRHVISVPTVFPLPFLLSFLLFLGFSITAPPAEATDYDRDPYEKEHGLIRDDEFFLVRQGTEGNYAGVWYFEPENVLDAPSRRAPNQWQHLTGDSVWMSSGFSPWDHEDEAVLFGYAKDYAPHLVEVSRASTSAPIGTNPGDLEGNVEFRLRHVDSGGLGTPSSRTSGTYYKGSFGAVATDLDGDGISEIVVAGARENRSPLAFGGISLANGIADANNTVTQTSPADSTNSGVYSGVRLAAGDLDGDGAPELVAVFQCADDEKETQDWATIQIGIHIAGDAEITEIGHTKSYSLKRLHEGKTATTVKAVTPLSYFLQNTRSDVFDVALGDFDGDGKDEILLAYLWNYDGNDDSDVYVHTALFDAERDVSGNFVVTLSSSSQNPIPDLLAKGLSTNGNFYKDDCNSHPLCLRVAMADVDRDREREFREEEVARDEAALLFLRGDWPIHDGSGSILRAYVAMAWHDGSGAVRNGSTWFEMGSDDGSRVMRLAQKCRKTGSLIAAHLSGTSDGAAMTNNPQFIATLSGFADSGESDSSQSCAVPLMLLREDGSNGDEVTYGPPWYIRTYEGPFFPVAGDADGDSAILGEALHFVIEHDVAPVLFLDEPPKHLDVIDGKERNVSRYSGLYARFEDTESKEDKATNTSATDTGYGVGEEVDLSFGTKVQFLLGSSEYQAQIKEKFSASWTTKREEIETGYSKKTFSISGQTNTDDLLLYRCRHIHVWRYKILGHFETADDDSVTGPLYYQVTIPEDDTSVLALIPGMQVPWYQPIHENGNLFSYPSSYLQIEGQSGSEHLTDIVELAVGGNDVEQNVSWLSGKKEELSEGSSKTYAVDSSVSCSGKWEGLNSSSWEASVFGNYDQTTSSMKSSENTVEKEEAFSVVIPGRPNMSTYPYRLDSLMYKTEAGTITLRYAISPQELTDHNKGWWAFYRKAPDPALNLPRKWRWVGENASTREDDWEWSDDEDAAMIRGISFSSALGDRLPADLPIGEDTTLSCRVYNYSLQSISNVAVRFEIAPLDPETGETGDRTTIATPVVPSLSAWGGTSSNWQMADATLKTEEFAAGNYRIFVTVDPDDAIVELADHDNGDRTGNNEGWFDLFLYGEESDEASASSGTTDKSGTDRSFNLTLLKDRVSAGKTVLDPGERTKVTVYCKNTGQRVATNIHALFFHDHPDNGKGFHARLLSGLLPGATGKMSAIFSDMEPGVHHIYVKLLGKTRETDFEDNIVSLDITVRERAEAEEGGSGGCDAGTGWAGLFAAGLFCLTGIGTFSRKQKR